MKATRCTIPSACAFSRDLGGFYYWDSFEVGLRRTALSMTEIYLGIFAHLPRNARRLFLIRDKIVSLFGIKGPTAAELDNIEIKERYAVGERIARFILFSRDDSEIITGGNDKHLDFRVSVLKVNEGGASKVVLTTVVDAHNLLGKVYLFFILPFHRFGVRKLLSNAAAANRI